MTNEIEMNKITDVKQLVRGLGGVHEFMTAMVEAGSPCCARSIMTWMSQGTIPLSRWGYVMDVCEKREIDISYDVLFKIKRGAE